MACRAYLLLVAMSLAQPTIAAAQTAPNTAGQAPPGEFGKSSSAGSPAADSSPEEEPLPDLTKARPWTDRNGRAVSGVLDQFVGEEVQLRVGAKTQRIAYQAFCDEDQAILRRYMESRRQGTSVPASAKDLPDQRPRTWRDKSDRSVYGILRRIDAEGRVVLQLDDRTSAFLLSNFSAPDQQHVRDQLALLGKSDLLPADDAIRTWRDWKGREFTGKLDPLFPPRSIVRTIHFLLDGGLRRSLDFVALDETSRELVRQLLEDEGGGEHLPEAFPEPATAIRRWTFNGRGDSVEGKFVRLAETVVIVRTESDAERPFELASLAPEDRRYVEEVLELGGGRTPIVRADCREWIFGPVCRGNKVTAKFSEAAEGYVKLLLPDDFGRAATQRFVAIPYLCLSADDRQFAREQWTGDAAALAPLAEPAPELEVRDWSFDEDRQTLRGSLHYITDDTITISQPTGKRRLRFDKLGGVDMDYVRRVIEAYGIEQFAPPAAEAGLLYSGPDPPASQGGVQRSTLTLPKNEMLPQRELWTPLELGAYIGGVFLAVLAAVGLANLVIKFLT